MNSFTLALKHGQVLYCTFSNQQLTLHHMRSSQALHFSGIFAEAILSLQTEHPQQAYLQRIEQAHPHLDGLSQATLMPKKAGSLLLGESLGMVFVELTSKCNERCLHCYAESAPERHDFLSFHEIFTGGDPLIHRDLLPLVQTVQELDFQGLEIYTNGLLLSDGLLQKLQPYQPQLSFSLYADCADIHDGITRVQGSWKRTLNALQRSMEQGFDVRVGVVIMQENAEHIVGLPIFLEERFGLPLDKIRFDPVNSVGRGSSTVLPDYINIESSHAIAQGEARRGKLCLASNGDVYPCIFSRQLRLGNIRQQSIPQMLLGLQLRDAHEVNEERWHACQTQLSCSDCQMIACLGTVLK